MSGGLWASDVWAVGGRLRALDGRIALRDGLPAGRAHLLLDGSADLVLASLLLGCAERQRGRGVERAHGDRLGFLRLRGAGARPHDLRDVRGLGFFLFILVEPR